MELLTGTAAQAGARVPDEHNSASLAFDVCSRKVLLVGRQDCVAQCETLPCSRVRLAPTPCHGGLLCVVEYEPRILRVVKRKIVPPGCP